VAGSGRLVSTLHEAGLVDEYRLMVFPIVIGGGQCLFDGVGMPVSLRLAEARSAADTLLLRYVTASEKGTAAERTPDIASPMPCFPPCERSGQL
jgi:dihydrofolate reductase